MKLLKEIYEDDVGNNRDRNQSYNLRKAARAIVLNSKGEIPLLFVSKHNYHMLPGGGFEGEETVEEALCREILEETGCEIDIQDELGIIIEFTDKFQKVQFSYCFIANQKGDQSQVQFTEKELSQGFVLKWVSLSNALTLLENDQPQNYEGKFIQLRDTTFLKEAVFKLNQNKK